MGYKVQKGDGWYKIAKNTGIDVNELLKLNNATLNTVIHPGQEIKTKAQNNQSGLGKYVQGFTKEETSKTMPTPYKPEYIEQQFIRDNAKSIQQQLVKAGYDLGKYDGIWGPKSQAALERAKKDGSSLQNGKLVSGKPATTANAFVPMGAQAMVQRGQTQAVSQPQLQTTGSAFYISYPKHPISTGGTPLKYITPTLPLGHSASIIMDENGNATYHTYGRYGNRGSYITKALPSMLKGESKQAYLERIRPHLEYADKNEPVKATYVSNVDSKKSRQYYKDEPQKDNYGFIIGSTCVGEACNGINAGRNFSKGELFQYITPNTPDLQHTLYGNETYHF